MAKHIVVIDDCQVTLAILSDILKEAGFKVSTAEDSVYSNHLIYGSTPPDLILLDVMLPHMSGDKKATLLKNREKSRNIPILLISSKEEMELHNIVIRSGANGYLKKPFNSEQLLSKVYSHLSN